MALTIDELNIKIEAESKQATGSIDSLIQRLESLLGIFGKFSSAGNKATKTINAVGNAAGKANSGLTKIIENFANGQKPLQGFTDKLARNISKWRTLYSVFQNAANTMSEWFAASNDYVETLNLFNVTMGKGAVAAKEFADSVSDAMGIDVAEWMNYQGTFKQLTSGFGIVEDKANTMSKNLTQLSYDLASFFNTDVETAFEKLSSAMAGQVKGLREFGIDTTVASLQEYALAKGIDKSVRSMTQAEKSMLRYNYIMENSIKIQGDMARTIATPANSIRILTALLTQMKRALGNIVSVIVVKFIPYVQAMVEIITDAANSLAKFLGYELPEIDYSGLGSGFSDEFEDAEDSLDGVSDSIKAIKKQLMGFDELNIISNPDTSSSGAGAGAGAGGVMDMTPIEYDFLAGLKTDKLDEIKEKIKEVAKWAGVVAAVIAGWKLGGFIADLATAGMKAEGLKQSLKLLGKKFTITAGVTLTVAGLVLEGKGIYEAITEELNKFNFSEILGGGALTVGGGALIGKGIAGSIGAALGSGIGAVIAGIPMYITGIYDAIMNGLNWLNGVLIPAGATLAGAGIGAIIGSLGGPIGTGIGALIGLAVGALTDLGILVYENWNVIVNWCSQALVDIGQFFVNLWDGISSAASACWDAIVEFFSPAIKWFSQLFGNIWHTISDVFYNIGVIASGCWKIIQTVWGIVSEWFNKHVIFPLSNFFSGLWKGFVEKAKSAWEGVKQVFGNVASFFRVTFEKAWRGIVRVFSVAGDIFVKIKDGIVSAFKKIVNGLIGGINSVVAFPFNKLNEALMWLKDLEILGIAPFKNLKEISVPQIPLLAEGGIVNEGQMFIAREAGPELVGQIGNKTAVANNDQIINGIANGVYRAMMAANGNGSKPININATFTIDGEIVGRKVIKYHNGIVMQTGESPLLV